jgi:hypothetical protein
VDEILQREEFYQDAPSTSIENRIVPDVNRMSIGTPTVATRAILIDETGDEEEGLRVSMLSQSEVGLAGRQEQAILTTARLVEDDDDTIDIHQIQ